MLMRAVPLAMSNSLMKDDLYFLLLISIEEASSQRKITIIINFAEKLK